MTTIGNRARTLIIAFLVGVIALGAGIAVAHSDGTEICITAMRLDDGRIEFAIQERDGEGWGERVLPRQRFFPTTSEGRWLNSTPITVGVADELEPATATLTATATPTATSTPAGTPTATPQDAYGDTDAETANLWVYLWDSERYDGQAEIEASVLMPTDLDTFDLNVSVAVGRHSGEFCNSSPIFDGVVNQLGCTGTDAGHSHTQVSSVTATVSLDYLTTLRYRCTKQAESDSEGSTWACWLQQ